jgi:hypothetical protein
MLQQSGISTRHDGKDKDAALMWAELLLWIPLPCMFKVSDEQRHLYVHGQASRFRHKPNLERREHGLWDKIGKGQNMRVSRTVWSFCAWKCRVKMCFLDLWNSGVLALPAFAIGIQALGAGFSSIRVFIKHSHAGAQLLSGHLNQRSCLHSRTAGTGTPSLRGSPMGYITC